MSSGSRRGPRFEGPAIAGTTATATIRMRTGMSGIGGNRNNNQANQNDNDNDNDNANRDGEANTLTLDALEVGATRRGSSFVRRSSASDNQNQNLASRKHGRNRTYFGEAVSGHRPSPGPERPQS